MRFNRVLSFPGIVAFFVLAGCATGLATGDAPTSLNEAGQDAGDEGVDSGGPVLGLDAGNLGGDDAAQPVAPDAWVAPGDADVPTLPHDAGPPDDASPPPHDAAPDTKDADVADATPVSPTGVVLPTLGEVVISEVMFNPSDATNTDGEWIELYNTTSETKLLSGLTLTDGSKRTATLAGGPDVTIAANSYVLLVHDEAEVTGLDQIPASIIAYQYTDILLDNGSTGGISLSNGSTVLASVPYGPWGMSVSGASIQLSVLTPAFDQTNTNWCLSSNSWAPLSDLGTPGAASDCP